MEVSQKSNVKGQTKICNFADINTDMNAFWCGPDSKNPGMKRTCENVQPWSKLAKKKCSKIRLCLLSFTEMTSMASPITAKLTLKIICWMNGILGKKWVLYFLHTIRKVEFLSKNSILTKPQQFHEFFTQIFFWQFFLWNQSCQQLKSPKPQHFHPEKSTIFSGNQSWIFGQKMKISNSVFLPYFLYF